MFFIILVEVEYDQFGQRHLFLECLVHGSCDHFFLASLSFDQLNHLFSLVFVFLWCSHLFFFFFCSQKYKNTKKKLWNRVLINLGPVSNCPFSDCLVGFVHVFFLVCPCLKFFMSCNIFTLAQKWGIFPLAFLPAFSVVSHLLVD